MKDNKEIIEKMINSLKEVLFEFDIEDLKNHMKLEEVSNDELNKLGENEVNKKFNNGEFKIKMPNGNLIDINSIKKMSLEKGIKNPVLFKNPTQKYVKWVVQKDFTTKQIKRKIKIQLKPNSSIDLVELKKELLNEEIKNAKTGGNISGLPLKTSNQVCEGKFYIQASCSRQNVINIGFNVLEELEKEKENYVNSKISNDYKKVGYYTIFFFFICILWYVNRSSQSIPNWLNNVIAFVLFVVPLLILRLINHNFLFTLINKKEAIKKFEQEFFDNIQ